MRKRIIRIATCLVLCLAIGAIGMALAEQTEITEVVEEEVYARFRVDPAEAERQYLNGLFDLPVTPVEDLPRLRGSVSGDSFSEGSRDRILYEALRDRIRQIDEGTLTSTLFTLSEAEFARLEVTAGAIGMPEGESMFGADGKLTDDARPLVSAYLSSYVSPAVNAIFYDYPYETFWRDASFGFGYAYAKHYDSEGKLLEEFTLLNLKIFMYVSQDYSATGAAYTTDINPTLFSNAQTAVRNAQGIITTNAGLGNYEKLTAYKDAICELTDYNKPAAEEGWDYGDPWQMVNVFDGDPKTKVVCEGYSKAFYYLCDKSSWIGNAVQVICVSGNMWDRENENSSFNPGAHMWNIVRMNGVNYLADVTNTDSGNPGLFLDGYDEMLGNDVYLYESGKHTTGAVRYLGYSFDNDSITLYQSGGWLNLATAAAEPEPYLFVSKSKAMIGEDVTITACLPGAGHIRVKSQKGYFINDQLTEIQEGDTGEWTVSFDEPGEYTLSVDGWSDERWNNPEIPNVSEFPDMWGNDSITVTVSYAGFPDSIVPGEDVTITIAPIEGANVYEISVQPQESWNIIYDIVSPQAGTFVIPAMVFADGFEGAINVSILSETEEGSEDLFWDYHLYNVAAYTGAETLTISEGAYNDGLQTINLSVTDAEQVIIQEEDYDNDGQVPIPYWTTICTANNPGAAVIVRPQARKVHQIRAAVKQNGVWSAWSPVIEITTPIHGRCNENIEWTLSDSGKLTISGTGEIPGNYEMIDPLYDFKDEVTEVEIGSGITGIGYGVFIQFDNLETVTIPASLTTIGEEAFNECGKLRSISNPGAATTAHKRCYYEVIKDFSLPSTVTEIGYCAFGDTPLFGVNTAMETDFEIPSGTAVIENYAFYGIDATSIRMTPRGLNSCSIGEYAFGSCTSLRYFYVDDWYSEVNYSIADKAFDECSTELIFIGVENEELRTFAEGHGFVYLEDEAVGGNG